MNKTYKYTVASGASREITFDTGVAKIALSNANGTDSGGGTYELPVASDETLGGIKVGNGLSIDENGILNVNKVYSTTEQAVGTWIDGKPVYEKTVVVLDDDIVFVSFDGMFLSR